MFSREIFSISTGIRIAVAVGAGVVFFIFAPIAIAIAGSALLIAAALVGEKKPNTQPIPIQTDTAITTAWFVLNNLDDAVVVYDEQFTIRAMNPVAERLLSLQKDLVIGTSLTPNAVHNASLALLAYVLFPSVAPSFTTLSEAGMWPERMILTISTPSLELITTLHRVAENTGKYLFIKVIRNATHERSLMESKGEFIRVAAHQLRTPLTALNWALNTLKPVVAEKAPESVAVVVQAIETAERAVKTTNDLLDSTRIEDGNMTLVIQNNDVGALVEKIVKEIMPFAKERSVTVIYTKPADTCVAAVDETLISAAIANLVDNAIRYNVLNGTVTVSVTRDSERITITIADTGIGIPQEDRARIFEKLYRASNAAQHEPNGSGLGLYITKTIVERHRGTITHTSIPQRGTTFTVTLPAVDVSS